MNQQTDRDRAAGRELPGPAAGPTLQDRFRSVHEEIRAEPKLAGLDRMAMVLHDPATDSLKTFLESGSGVPVLEHYEAPLAEVHALRDFVAAGQTRVINDMAVFDSVQKTPARSLRERGFRSSLMVPVLDRGRPFGCIFCNSREPDFFQAPVIQHLKVYAQLVSLFVIHEFREVHTLQAAVLTVRDIGTVRDANTGAHLDRMSRIARVIAAGVAGFHGLSDEFVEFVFEFAPLHDIGKVGIPDSILLNPGPLSEEERRLMQGHVEKGLQIVERMLRNFGLESIGHADILRNIVACHHEALSGSGYPRGLKGVEIPVEARIAAVADVFDALTSSRPYKRAWTNAEALAYLRARSGTHFEPECVEALAEHMDKVIAIQAHFPENPLG